jgi:hypothetical protein
MHVLRAAVLTASTILLVANVEAKVVGGCRFDTNALKFAGTATDQAKCLLRHVGKFAKLGPTLTELPPALGDRIGKPVDVTREAVRKHLTSVGQTEAKVGGSLDSPVSRAKNNAPGAPKARYFVIHDTSSPWLGNNPFPSDIDTSASINNLAGYAGPNAVAHMFINRRGELLTGHDFGTPWRATKLETQAVGVPAKGLFLHFESIQPRRRDPAGGPKNDAIAPMPGLTQAQYDRLALLYVVASVRAGEWMIPAFHAPIDDGLSDGHDDPQNFDLKQFDDAVAAVVKKMKEL